MLTVSLAESRRGVVVCTVWGEIDMTTAPLLAEKLQQPGQPRHLLIDLSGVTFIGSHGLLALVEARKAHDPDHLFALIAPSAATRLALNAIGLAELFPYYDEL
ncbi:MAG: STAS domain-containing protein, partial [Pseudonocardiaceae bacterium]